MKKLKLIEEFNATDGAVFTLFASTKEPIHVVRKVSIHGTLGIEMKNAVEWQGDCTSDAQTLFQRMCQSYEIFFSKLPALS